MKFGPEFKEIIPDNENVRYVYYNKIADNLSRLTNLKSDLNELALSVLYVLNLACTYS